MKLTIPEEKLCRFTLGHPESAMCPLGHLAVAMGFPVEYENLYAKYGRTWVEKAYEMYDAGYGIEEHYALIGVEVEFT